MSDESQELPVFTTAADMRAWVRKQKKSGRKVALVPTMVSGRTAEGMC